MKKIRNPTPEWLLAFLVLLMYLILIISFIIYVISYAEA